MDKEGGGGRRRIQRNVPSPRRETTTDEDDDDIDMNEDVDADAEDNDDVLSNISSSSTVYQCRRCPGIKITSSMRDVHRMTHQTSSSSSDEHHRNAKEELPKKPGPKSRTRPRDEVEASTSDELTPPPRRPGPASRTGVNPLYRGALMSKKPLLEGRGADGGRVGMKRPRGIPYPPSSDTSSSLFQREDDPAARARLRFPLSSSPPNGEEGDVEEIIVRGQRIHVHERHEIARLQYVGDAVKTMSFYHSNSF